MGGAREEHDATMKTFLPLTLIFCALGAGVTSAGETPKSCTAYDVARERAITTQGKAGKTSFGDLMMSYSATDAPAASSIRANAARDAALELAKLCIGDLASERRFDEALTIALRAGMLSEAISLQQLAKAAEPAAASGPPPAPTQEEPKP